MELNTFKNDWFKPGSKTKIFLWMIVSFLFLRTPFPWPFFLKKWMLYLFGCKFGKGLVIKPNVNIKYPWRLRLGDHVWIGEDVWIDNLANVTIDSNVCISQGAMLLTGNHDYKSKSFDLIIGEINLKEGVWIGAKSIVCPGVVCNEASVLSVGSVATNHLKPNKIYQGNPATIKKDRF